MRRLMFLLLVAGGLCLLQAEAVIRGDSDADHKNGQYPWRAR